MIRLKLDSLYNYHLFYVIYNFKINSTFMRLTMLVVPYNSFRCLFKTIICPMKTEMFTRRRRLMDGCTSWLANKNCLLVSFYIDISRFFSLCWSKCRPYVGGGMWTKTTSGLHYYKLYFAMLNKTHSRLYYTPDCLRTSALTNSIAKY